jgi:glycerophosphoryl diester phosphodiesterase
MRIAFIILSLISLTGCGKFDTDAVQNLNGGKIDIIGHGGSGVPSVTDPYHINSEQSIILALDGLFADGSEVDVQMSSDSVLFLYHDEQLDTKTACHGCIATSTAAQIAQCPYWSGIDDINGSQQAIITLDHILQRYASYENPPAFYLDCKAANFCDDGFVTDLSAMSVALADVIAKYDARSWVTVESRSQNLLNFVKAADPTINLVFDVDDPDHGIAVSLLNGYHGIATSNQRITKEQVTSAHDAGLSAHIFNVRSAAGHRNACNKWPDAVQTDNIEMMQDMLLD